MTNINNILGLTQQPLNNGNGRTVYTPSIALCSDFEGL